jgi:hypothetical protein
VTTNTLTFFDVTGTYYAVSDPSISGNTDSPVIQAISALVTFTPRIPKGQLFYVEDYLVISQYNAEQTLFLIGNPTGGSFTISFGGDTTTAIPWDANASAVQSALQALPSIGTGNVNVVADPSPQAYDLQFTGTLGNVEVPAVEGNADLLTNVEGEGFCEITVAVTAQGSPTVVADTAVAIPPLQARIWDGVLSTINFGDTPGFQLLSNSPVLNIDGQLLYDVTFSNITYNGTSQMIAPFAFAAPTDDTPVCLTDPTLTLYEYQAPNQVVWEATGTSAMNMGAVRPLRAVGSTNWRNRSMGRGA